MKSDYFALLAVMVVLQAPLLPGAEPAADHQAVIVQISEARTMQLGLTGNWKAICGADETGRPRMLTPPLAFATVTKSAVTLADGTACEVLGTKLMTVDGLIVELVSLSNKTSWVLSLIPDQPDKIHVEVVDDATSQIVINYICQIVPP